MKTVLLVVESLEPANLHRAFYNGFLKNGFIQNKKLNVIPLLCPRDVKFSHNVYDEMILHTVNKFRVDTFFTIGGEQIREETLRELKARGIKTAAWQIDDPYMLTEDYGKDIRKKLPFYDLIYTTNKYSLEKIYPRLNYPAKVKFLPFGFDPAFHCNLRSDKLYHMTFIGSSFPDRKNKYISKFLGLIELWGSNDPIWNHKGRISHSSMVELTNQSRINLNFSDQPANGVKCLKNRVTEVLGCGQFLLTERFPELEEMFTVGKDLDCFDSLEELDEKARFYIRNEAAREKIAKAGERKVKKFSYEKLISGILEEIF